VSRSLLRRGAEDRQPSEPLDVSGYRLAVVVSRYNPEIVDGLVAGARERLVEIGVPDGQITTFWVPGAFEIPQAARFAAQTGRFDAIICLGCLIKGETAHFDVLASATSLGIMDAAQATGVPMAFGVLTTYTEEEALARSAAGAGNKGREAAHAAVEMVTVCRGLGGGRSS